MIEIYTDGACNQTTFIGGWGYCIMEDAEVVYEDSGRVVNTTNNKMEMTAAIEALLHIKSGLIKREEIILYTDCSYMANGINDGWVDKWRQNGWVSSKKASVLNQSFWNQLQDLVLELGVQIKRIPRGHPGIKYADKKARSHTRA